MDEDELDQLLASLEEDVAAEVRAVLTEIADEYAAGLNEATEIVAARFSVTSIAQAWRARVPRLVRRLLRVSETAATTAADDTDAQLPDGWDNLPERYDDNTLPTELDDYVTATEHLLRAVGDRLSAAATAELADGLNAGENLDQLRARLRAAFAREGAQLGEAREQRIAATESTRAWNAATLGAARALTGPDRPLVKQWRTRGDSRVRHAHDEADGQLRLLDDTFTVAGVPMRYPGDPSAPADLTINCRCHIRLSVADRTAAATAPGAGYCYLNEDGSHCTCDGSYCADTAAATPAKEAPMDEDEMMPDEEWMPPARGWTTPDTTALAFENQETGDGRIFAPGALAWSNGPWPLQYAEEMLSGHDGAELAGAIQTMDRDGDRITGSGVLYLTTHAGFEAEWLLEQQAPLGVSVDLDDVDVEFIDRTSGEDTTAEPVTASLASASVLRLDDGSWIIRGHTNGEWTASGVGLARNARTVQWITAPHSTRVSAAAVRDAFPHLTAAAGDPDNPEQGTMVHSESAGDMLMRITRARVRGATLVAVPAFADARIVLDARTEQQPPADEPYALAAAAAPKTMREKVVRYIRGSSTPVTAREIAEHFELTIEAARAHLAGAVETGHLVRIARGQYVAATDLPEGELAAAMSGDLELPINDNRDATWDGPKAASRVLEWATDDAGNVDGDKLAKAFLYRDPDADPATLSAYKLGIADVYDGRLEIVARAVFAVAGVLEGAMGGVDIPTDEQDQIREAVEELYERLADKFGDDITPPWENDMSDLEASAWRAMQDLPALPAEWFQNPIEDGSLTDDSPGVNYSAGRIFGWVAKAGVPHASFPGKNLTVEKLAREGIDFSNFLRQRMSLDNGETVRVGPMTMSTGHHNDGARCETAACQFDDSKTTAGIITVGIDPTKGIWFSGAAAPWLSQWDMSTFMACSPSYHMVRGRKGWDFRAVLSVPVPGHPTPLVAAIASVVERSNLAITAAAALAEEKPVEADPQHERPAEPGATDALTAALLSPAFLDRFSAALEQRAADRAAELAALTADVALIRDEITASAAPEDSASDG